MGSITLQFLHSNKSPSLAIIMETDSVLHFLQTMTKFSKVVLTVFISIFIF